MIKIENVWDDRDAVDAEVTHYNIKLFSKRMKDVAMRKVAVIGAMLLGVAALSASPVSLKWSRDKGPSVSQDEAYAVVGRPGTPGSVAGVHRRVERREIRRGAY
jgi:hypothetical protein